MRASDLDWGKINHFSQSEWPKGILEHMDARLIGVLVELRRRLGHGIHPSPLSAGWARFDGSSTSQHYAVNRLSQAGDIFPDANILDTFLIAQAIPTIGGIGLYFDTHFKGAAWPMMHIDIREGTRQIWARMDGYYIYPLRGGPDRVAFWSELAKWVSPKN